MIIWWEADDVWYDIGNNFKDVSFVVFLVASCTIGNLRLHAWGTSLHQWQSWMFMFTQMMVPYVWIVWMETGWNCGTSARTPFCGHSVWCCGCSLIPGLHTYVSLVDSTDSSRQNALRQKISKDFKQTTWIEPPPPFVDRQLSSDSSIVQQPRTTS